MAHKLNLLLQFFVMIARDMLIGMIFGLTAAILLVKLNPFTENYVALLIPTGIIAGILKGMAKFVVIKIFSSLPTKGYRFNYPKFKLLFLWLVLLLGTLMYTYGLDLSKWFTGPQQMFLDNAITRNIGIVFWTILLIIISILGIGSYFYEPPYNKDEAMPLTEE